LKPVTVELTIDKQVFLNGEKIHISEFESALSKIAKSETKEAIIRADKNLPYGDVIKVMGMLQNAQILNIGVAVK
jgi:biopolymer transport protein ExbD